MRLDLIVVPQERSKQTKVFIIGGLFRDSLLTQLK